MKRAIVMPAVGDLPWTKFSIPRWESYAAATGASFRVEREFPDRTNFPNLIWVIISVLKRLGDDKFDQLLIIDADIIPRSDNPDVFQWFGDFDMVVAPDPVFTTVGSVKKRGMSLIERAEEHYGVTLPDPAAPYFNSGLVGLTRDALDRLDLDGPYHTGWPNDQDFLNIRTVGLTKIWLPMTWNWHMVRNWPASGAPEMLHFAAHRKQMMGGFEGIY